MISYIDSVRIQVCTVSWNSETFWYLNLVIFYHKVNNTIYLLFLKMSAWHVDCWRKVHGLRAALQRGRRGQGYQLCYPDHEDQEDDPVRGVVSGRLQSWHQCLSDDDGAREQHGQGASECLHDLQHHGHPGSLEQAQRQVWPHVQEESFCPLVRSNSALDTKSL